MMTSAETSFTFLGVFFLGLGLNLTPCVYPLISVTVSLFRPRTESPFSLANSFLRALTYVAGLVTMNAILGVAAALSGKMMGGLLQNPVVLFLIAAFFMWLALGMFGVYAWSIPSSWLNRLGSGNRGGSFVGLYLTGLVSGMFAAPCMGPALIGLMAWVGAKAEMGFALRVFLVLSMGLGLPYLILGTFSGLLNRLPKSGGWLVWVEKLFGCVLLAFSGFYFLTALSSPWLSVWIPLAFFMTGFYLGFLDHSDKYSRGFNAFRALAGLSAVLCSMFLFLSSPAEKVTWEPFSKAKLEASIQSGRPVILDFYADWCMPCRELEYFTYTNPQVIQAVQAYDRYKIDLTSEPTEEASALIERFEVSGVPTLVFLNPDGEEAVEKRIAGFVDAEEFLKILEMKS